MADQTPLKLADLTHALRELGIEPGDGVIVHSSCRSLGPVEGGADTVIDALLEVIGTGGNLMLPTFNYSRPVPDPYYDPATTPCRTGIIPEIGRQRPNAVRSLHPTHSVAVIGADADWLTRDHLAVRVFGVDSPVDRLAQRGGKVLLLGVGHTSNSTVHVAEEHAGLPKPHRAEELKLLMPDGRIATHTLDSSASCSAGFGAVEYGMRSHGEIRDHRLGSCLIQLMHGLGVIRRVREMIAAQPDVLLCTRDDCRSCQGVRRNLHTEAAPALLVHRKSGSPNGI